MDSDLAETGGRWTGTAIWVASSLLGPLPWILLATAGFEAIWGTPGYGVAFVGAPAVWTACSALAFLARRRWLVAVWALTGTALWWGLAL